MDLIPVLDLMGGHVVRGIAGQRHRYLPNQSRLVDGSDPVQTATAIRREFGVNQFYVAELDGLEGRGVSKSCLRKLIESGFNIVVDAGVSSPEDVKGLFDIGIQSVVIALESLLSLDRLKQTVEVCGAERLVFSLDLRQGQLVGSAAQGLSPMTLANRVIDAGIQRMIVLDLSGVGVNQGVPTLDLCHHIDSYHPHIELWTGGGVRSIADLRSCQQIGVTGVLVASCLHDGKITGDQWRQFRDELAR